MNQDEWTVLNATPLGKDRLSATEIGGPDRTLALGYTSERHTWHLYLENGLLHRLIYDGRSRTVVSNQASEQWLAAKLRPDKHLYPESVDARFAHLMRKRGHDLPYCQFSQTRRARVAPLAFHGLVFGPGMWTLRERTDPAVPFTPQRSDIERHDLVLNCVPDVAIDATLYLNGVEITGVHTHVIDPGASGTSHEWFTGVTELAEEAPASVVAQVTAAARDYHERYNGPCNARCARDGDEDL